jgi:hypothetical protein
MGVDRVVVDIVVQRRLLNRVLAILVPLQVLQLRDRIGTSADSKKAERPFLFFIAIVRSDDYS